MTVFGSLSECQCWIDYVVVRRAMVNDNCSDIFTMTRTILSGFMLLTEARVVQAAQPVHAFMQPVVPRTRAAIAFVFHWSSKTATSGCLASNAKR